MTTALRTAQIEEARRPAPPARGLPRVIALTFRQVVFNPFNLGFALLMPILMYMMFGNGQEYSLEHIVNGNVAAQILVSMTLFGVMLSTASLGANVSLERTQGLGRLFALTPLSPTWQIIGRLVTSVLVAAVVVALTFTVGFLTDASMSAEAWLTSAAMILLVSVLAAAIGLACGFAIRSDGAFAACSAIIVLSAFGAGMALPLDQLGDLFQRLAPWTPLWGANQLALLPTYGWDSFTPSMLASVLVWTGAFGALAIWGLRHDTKR